MGKPEARSEDTQKREDERERGRLPRPTPYFRLRSWLAFQRALDPLAPPRPLRRRRR